MEMSSLADASANLVIGAMTPDLAPGATVSAILTEAAGGWYGSPDTMAFAYSLASKLGLANTA